MSRRFSRRTIHLTTTVEIPVHQQHPSGELQTTAARTLMGRFPCNTGDGSENETDSQLMKRVGQGELSALGELYERHYQHVTAILFRCTGSRLDAEDLAQELFLRLLLSGSRYDSKRPFAPWMHAIARNLCRDWHRRRSRGQEPLTDRLEGSRDVHDLGWYRTVVTEIHLVASRLPPAYREALRMAVHEGLSCEEMAVRSTCSPATIRWRVHRAKSILRTALAHLFGAEEEARGAPMK